MSDAGALHSLKREIGLLDPTALSIGAIFGSGIFIVTSIVAVVAGKAMICSVLFAGVTAIFSVMNVAEPGVFTFRKRAELKCTHKNSYMPQNSI